MNATEKDIEQDLERIFRNEVAPAWYLWGTIFADEELNRHCKIILKNKNSIKG